MENWETGKYILGKQEEYAENQDRYFKTHTARKSKINICHGTANWNACDYLDLNKQTYSDKGCLCWMQDKANKCCHCQEIIVK
jgi:hypothetical protein